MIRIAVISLVIVSAWKTVFKQTCATINKATWKYDDSFEIELANNENTTGKLLPGSLVTEWLVILHVYCEGNKKIFWLLARDSLDDDIYRKLCVRLRQYQFDR